MDSQLVVAYKEETIEQRYANEAQINDTPTLPARGLPQIDVFARIDGDDFAAFHEAAGEAATLAREAFDEDDKSVSRELWSDLLGDVFPEYGNDDSDDGGEKAVNLDSSSKSTSVSDQRFA